MMTDPNITPEHRDEAEALLRHDYFFTTQQQTGRVAVALAARDAEIEKLRAEVASPDPRTVWVCEDHPDQIAHECECGGAGMLLLHHVDARDAKIERLTEEHHSLRGIIATSFDRLNTALREANCCEAIGDPYRSFALRDGIVALYDRGAEIRAQVAALTEERDALHGALKEDVEVLGPNALISKLEWQRIVSERDQSTSRIGAKLAAAEARVRDLEEALPALAWAMHMDGRVLGNRHGLSGMSREDTARVSAQIAAALRSAGEGGGE